MQEWLKSRSIAICLVRRVVRHRPGQGQRRRTHPGDTGQLRVRTGQPAAILLLGVTTARLWGL